MRTPLLTGLLALSLAGTHAQKPTTDRAKPAESTTDAPLSRTLNLDKQVVTNGQVTIKGQRVPYKATAGTIPVWDEEGKPAAGVF